MKAVEKKLVGKGDSLSTSEHREVPISTASITSRPSYKNTNGVITLIGANEVNLTDYQYQHPDPG